MFPGHSFTIDQSAVLNIAKDTSTTNKKIEHWRCLQLSQTYMHTPVQTFIRLSSVCSMLFFSTTTFVQHLAHPFLFILATFLPYDSLRWQSPLHCTLVTALSSPWCFIWFASRKMTLWYFDHLNGIFSAKKVSFLIRLSLLISFTLALCSVTFTAKAAAAAASTAYIYYFTTLL